MSPLVLHYVNPFYVPIAHNLTDNITAICDGLAVLTALVTKCI